jgi:phospholipid/cholesterol/gamma-HCH transport system permease protein
MSGASIAAWRIERRGDTALLTLSGDWLVGGSGFRAVADLGRLRDEVGSCAVLRFDSSALARWDSALVAFVRALPTSHEDGRGLDLDLSGLPVPAQRLLSLAAADHRLVVSADIPVHRSLAWRIGAGALRGWSELVAAAELLGLTVLSITPALRGRLRARPADVIALMRESGLAALGIIAVVNGLVGAILAFVGAVQLQRFGASIYVANLVGVAVIREMAAIMTGIVMAGRTGGAYAAQIATMEGNEEVDALRALGISPYNYLVVPRAVALVTMMPVMYFYACLAGLTGGLLVSVVMLDMAPTMFLGQLRAAVSPTEFFIGLTKSVSFGAFIALAGCRLGLRAGRSAADVGWAATGAVVAGIIGIIALDAVFAACTNVIGI